MHPSECFRLLGLPRTANLEEIKLAYRRLARKYHPDVNQTDPLAAAEKFRTVQQAYQILKDLPKDNQGVVIERSSPRPPTPKPSQPPKVEVKVKVQAKTPEVKVTPPHDPEQKLKLDTLKKVQDLLRQRKYLVAVPIAEAMRSRFSDAPEVIHWQAVVYQRLGCELLQQGKLRQAEIYLNKALNTDPQNRELCFEVKRDLERIRQMASP
ncbi:MAG: DnaJ domain-containing protein [Pseudanabaenaceae cyanobacterium bins.68]|nr:DnaJ domain-containing protein [Pseudanabaenaceae cyanobacterium bins.68]